MTEAIEKLVAYEGDFEILSASWDIHIGRSMDLRIVEKPDGEGLAHPFKRFRRSNGRPTGTRFNVSMFRTDDDGDQICGDTEVIIKSWGEHANKGQWVKFLIEDCEGVHPLEGLSGRIAESPGSIIYIVFVEISDDNSAVRQSESGTDKKKMKPSQYAHLRCFHDEFFIQFLTEKVPLKSHPKWTPEVAKMWVKSKCNIESFSDLDKREDARALYRDKVYKPYARYRGFE